MIVNGRGLLNAAPIVDMLEHKETFEGLSHGLTEAGYDIRIKQSISFYPKGTFSYTCDDKGNCHRVLMEEDTIYIDNEILKGRFALASAIEKFDMPKNLLGVVHDKSSWARKGLSVFNTVIEPNWKGYLTLELAFKGSKPVIVPAGTGIAQVLFHKLSEEASYEGKYDNQPDRPVGPIESV